MNKTMISSPFKDLNEFLAKHSVKNTQKDSNSNEKIQFTHTRIPCIEKGIYPGLYNIPTQELPIFYEKYYHSIFVENKKEYLTERQLENGGPMAVDFDFRYSYDVDTRKHTKEHIRDMICEYF